MSYVKYRNRKAVLFGLKFDSEAEGRRYLQLRSDLLIGRIENLALQVSFELIPKYTNPEGKKIRATTYKADFVYDEVETGRHIIEDVKGFDRKTGKFRTTAEYKLKKKLFEYLHQGQGWTITEVTA